MDRGCLGTDERLIEFLFFFAVAFVLSTVTHRLSGTGSKGRPTARAMTSGLIVYGLLVAAMIGALWLVDEGWLMKVGCTKERVDDVSMVSWISSILVGGLVGKAVAGVLNREP